MFSGKKIVFLDKRHPLSLLIMLVSSLALLGKALCAFHPFRASSQCFKVRSSCSHLEKTTSSRIPSPESIYLLLWVTERM